MVLTWLWVSRANTFWQNSSHSPSAVAKGLKAAPSEMEPDPGKRFSKPRRKSSGLPECDS